MSKPQITITGPQGSGKTTLMRVIATALAKSEIAAQCYDDGMRVILSPLTEVPESCPLHTSGVDIVTGEEI